MWRMGFDSPENFDDDQTYCGSVEYRRVFMLILAVIITAEVGGSSGMKIVDGVESVEILGMTFQENTKHPWVKETSKKISLSNFFF